MTKLAHVAASRQVSRTAVRGPITKARAAARKVDPAWIEFADHVIMEKFPFVAIATELAKSARTGSLSLRAVLLVVALAI
jgi:hypothetical protein